MLVSKDALRVEARYALGDILQLWKRNMLAYRRQPDLLVFSTIQPVMFVLLFAFVFGGAIQTGPVDYIDFLLPGILAQSVLFGSTQTGVGLAVDVTSGMIDRFRTLPMARSAVVAGRIMADITRNVFVVALGTDFWEPLVKALAWMVGIMAVFVPLAVWRYRSIQ